jgi:hypothetical protein
MALDAIKICAAIFMVIATAGQAWGGDDSGFSASFGIAAFILFCFAQAMAMLRHDPLKAPRYAVMKYGMRIFVIALLVEPISLFTRDIAVPNVLFALTLASVFSGFCRKLKPLECYAAAVFLLLAATAKAPFEAGLAGVALPAMILLSVKGERPASLFAALAVVMVALGGRLLDTTAAPAEYAQCVIQAVVAVALSLLVLQLARFAPHTGRLLPKYALHAFYPLQLLAIWGLFRL